MALPSVFERIKIWINILKKTNYAQNSSFPMRIIYSIVKGNVRIVSDGIIHAKLNTTCYIYVIIHAHRNKKSITEIFSKDSANILFFFVKQCRIPFPSNISITYELRKFGIGHTVHINMLKEERTGVCKMNTINN